MDIAHRQNTASRCKFRMNHSGGLQQNIPPLQSDRGLALVCPRYRGLSFRMQSYHRPATAARERPQNFPINEVGKSVFCTKNAPLSPNRGKAELFILSLLIEVVIADGRVINPVLGNPTAG